MLGIHTLVEWASGRAADGFTTVIVLILLTGSIIMISLGIIGYYLAQIYIESKERPRYLIAEDSERRKNDGRTHENDPDA